ncbi:MAG: hypothetical protein [aquatic viral metagenome]
MSYQNTSGNKSEQTEVEGRKGKQQGLSVHIPVMILLIAIIVIGMYVGSAVGTQLGVMAGAQIYIASGSESIVLNATHEGTLANSALKEGAAESASTIASWTILGTALGGVAGLVAGIELVVLFEKARRAVSEGING